MSHPNPSHPLDNRSAVPDYARFFADWRERGGRLQARSGALCTLRYGPAPRAELDWLAAGRPNRPTIALIHGGYWQWNSRQDFVFAAEGALNLGLNVAVIGYTLAPEARLGQIVTEIGCAVDWLTTNCVALGAGDALYLMGWSAGAHLAAMQLKRPALAGLIGISGVYELSPVRASPLDAALCLSDDDVINLSPLRQRQTTAVPVLLGCGGNELAELQRQTVAYAEELRAANQQVSLHIVSGRHHYDVLEEFAQPNGVLLAAAARAFGW